LVWTQGSQANYLSVQTHGTLTFEVWTKNEEGLLGYGQLQEKGRVAAQRLQGNWGTLQNRQGQKSITPFFT
jgi:acyl CoA:acetate/3-ketoacid CoA transferase beta subunit